MIEAAAIGLTLGTGELAALGIEASMAARVLLWADRAAFALGLVTSTLRDHRGWILSHFGDSGRELLHHVDLVHSAVAIYGVGRMALGMAQLVKGLAQSWSKWRSTRASAGTGSKSQEQALDDIDQGIGEFVGKVDEIQGARAPAARSAGSSGRFTQLATADLPPNMDPTDIAIQFDEAGRVKGVVAGPEFVDDGVQLDVHIRLAGRLEGWFTRLRLELHMLLKRLQGSSLTGPQIKAAKLEIEKHQALLDAYLKAADAAPLTRGDAEAIAAQMKHLDAWEQHWQRVLKGEAAPEDFDGTLVFARSRRNVPRGDDFDRAIDALPGPLQARRSQIEDYLAGKDTSVYSVEDLARHFEAGGTKVELRNSANLRGAYEAETIAAPGGASIPATTSRQAIVPNAKVEVYLRGRVRRPDNWQDELADLQRFKQARRKEFDADPSNEARLKYLRDNIKHNVERSESMAAVLDAAGIPDTPENNRLLIVHLLEQGATEAAGTARQTRSVYIAPGGERVVLEARWKVIDDGGATSRPSSRFPRGLHERRRRPAAPTRRRAVRHPRRGHPGRARDHGRRRSVHRAERSR